MKKRDYDILRYLDETREWKTAKVISAHFDISIRQVKYIISRINEKEELIISSRKGYLGNSEKKEIIQRIIAEGNEKRKTIDNKEFRKEYVMKKLLTEDKGVCIYQLSDDLFLNENSTRQIVLSLTPIFANYNLKIENKNNGYCIIGSEKNKRKMMSAIISNEAKKGFVLENIAKEVLSRKELEYFNELLEEELRTHHLFFNDYSFMNLIIHLIIVIERFSEGFILTNNETRNYQVDETSLMISKNLFHKINEILNIPFNQNEIINFALLINSQTQIIHSNSEESIEKLISKNAYLLVNQIVSSVKKEYLLDLSDNNFLMKFALHIDNLLLRIKIDHYSKNPYVDYIKTACPIIYEISVFIANVIYKNTKIRIDDNEIAFLALHLSAVYDTTRNSEKVKAVLVCPSYYDLAENIVNSIYKACDYNISVQMIANNENELINYEFEYDLLLSTISLKEHYRKETIYFSPLLIEKEKSLIKEAVNRIVLKNKGKGMRSSFINLFDEEILFLDTKYDDFKEVINALCRQMIKKEYFDDAYIDKVLERENLSSTAYGKIAIPHSLKACGKKSGVGVLIQEKAIHWIDKEVNIVFLLSIQPEEQLMFNDFLNKITELLSDDKLISDLLKCKNYQSFINIICKEKEFDY